MLKSEVSKLVRFGKENHGKKGKNTVETVLNNCPTSEEIKFINSRVSTIVWGIMTHEQKLMIYEFFIEGKKTNEVKRLIIDIKRLIINTLEDFNIDRFKITKISEIIHTSISKSKGVALEYFILDILLRNGVKANKGSPHLDKNKIDLITKYHGIIFGNQITALKNRESKRLKEIEIEKLRIKIDNKLYIEENPQIHALNQDNFPSDSIPDLPILFIVNGGIANKLKKDNNVLKEAYETWKNEGFKEGGPSIYLENDDKKEIDFIGKSYPIGIEAFTNFIKDKRLNKNRSDRKDLKGGYNYKLNYLFNENKIEICFHKGQEFIYSLTFFITDKFLEKIKNNT